MNELISRETAIQTVHETMYQFIDDGETMTDRDGLLLKVNKAICNRLKEIPTENKGEMTEQWQELKETITEMRDNDGTGTQQEVCKFLVNLMDVLEKQMSDSENPTGDLISRKSLLNKINAYVVGSQDKEFICKLIKEMPSVEPCREVDDYENEIADLHNRLDIAEYDKERYKEEITTLEAKSKGEWIPVSNRLPEDRQSVLVWCPQYKNIYCACLEKEQWWIFGAFMKVQDEVVAWMPLPEPYKAESEVSE